MVVSEVLDMDSTCPKCGNATPTNEMCTYGKCESCAVLHLSSVTDIGPASGDRVDAKKYECDGRMMTVREWARELGITVQSLSARIKKWGTERALTERRYQRSQKSS